MREKFNRLLPIALVLVFALSRWPGMLPQNFSAAYALALHLFLVAPVSLVGLVVLWRMTLPGARKRAVPVPEAPVKTSV